MRSLNTFTNIGRKYMEMKQRRGDESRQEIDELRVLDSEEYTELKIKLETEIQTREQYLQEVVSNRFPL
jgi:hypothetical protein